MKRLSNYELQKLTKEVAASMYPEYRAPGIAVELARRELQRMNPRSAEDPCVFKKACRTSCRWGSFGCAQEHCSTSGSPVKP